MDKLGVNDLKEITFVNRTWSIILEDGSKPQDLERPGFWAHVAMKLTRRDEIRFWANDGSFYGQAVVRATGRLEAVVALTQVVDFKTGAVVQMKARDYEVAFSGEKSMWCVYRLKQGRDGGLVKDGGPIKAGFQTEDAAKAWLADHVKAIAA